MYDPSTACDGSTGVGEGRRGGVHQPGAQLCLVFISAIVDFVQCLQVSADFDLMLPATHRRYLRTRVIISAIHLITPVLEERLFWGFSL